MAQTFVIYRCTCSVTGKVYIGQTSNLRRRLLSHQKSHSGCLAFKNAISKHGWESFEITTLHEGLTADEADDIERQLIIDYDSISPGGYNLMSGGKAQRKYSDESRARMRAAKVGKQLTAEHREKMRLAKLGKQRSSATRTKMQSIQNQRKGIPRTDEVKQKIREAALKRNPRTPDQKQSHREACQTEEFKQKLRDAWVIRKQQQNAPT